MSNMDGADIDVKPNTMLAPDGPGGEWSREAHIDSQRAHSDGRYADGPRAHTTSADPLVRYLVEWRLRTSVARFLAAAGGEWRDWNLLVLCSGEGSEGRLLLDMGFRNVTVSDLSPSGVAAARTLDPRLDAIVLDAEESGLGTGSYDLVIVQDGLHHLPRPTLGFTEMLRIAKIGAFFLEPHDSYSGWKFGRTWEINGDAENFVFRWDRHLVESVASSYLGRDRFTNHSFSFWHHNPRMEALGRKFGDSERALKVIRAAKRVGDGVAARYGNSFCGMVVHRRQPELP